MACYDMFNPGLYLLEEISGRPKFGLLCILAVFEDLIPDMQGWLNPRGSRHRAITAKATKRIKNRVLLARVCRDLVML